MSDAGTGPYHPVAVPMAALPHVRPTLGHLAWTDPAVCHFKLPIMAAAGDQQAGLFGQGLVGRPRQAHARNGAFPSG